MTASGPDWNALYETAASQDGHFTTVQAAEAGYSRPLLAKHLANGRLRRVMRGVYRVVHFPAGEHEDLACIWLWSGRKGVFSHETALALHQLSDVLPSRIHLTVPVSWEARRLRVPAGTVLHFADVTASDRAWHGAVPITTVQRTLDDCRAAEMSQELLSQAVRQARQRGLIRPGNATTRRPVVR